MNIIEEYKSIDEKQKIQIWQDELAENPFADFIDVCIISKDKRYNITGKDSYDLEDLKEYDRDVYLVSDLFILDHSGINLSTTSFQCQWDSWHLGYIVVKKEDYNNVEDLLHTWNDWSNGRVFGYSLFDLDRCECCGNINESLVDSCGGFFGSLDLYDVCAHINQDSKNWI